VPKWCHFTILEENMRADNEPYRLYLRTLSSGKKVYYFRYRTENGVRSPSYSTNTNNLAKAKRFCQKLYNEGKLVKNKTILFKKYVSGFFGNESKYVQWKKVNGNPIKPNTLESYREKLKFQILPYFGEIEIENITIQTIKNWIVWASKKWSPKTINNAQGVLSIILKQARDEMIIPFSPVDGIQYRKIIKKNRILLSVQELNAIYNFNWKSERKRTAVLIAMITGMRIGEVCALRTEDVHEDYLDVQHSWSQEYGIGTTKTGIKRIVPIPKELHDILIAHAKEWIFPFRGGTPYAPHAIYNSFVYVCQKLGIDRKERGITVHSLRNSFISYLTSCNVPHKKIQATVGHEDEDMTDWYTIWSHDMFDEVYSAQKQLYADIIKAGETENGKTDSN
jgi:integrase